MSVQPLIAILEDDDVLGRSLVQRFRLEGYGVLWCKTAADGEKMLLSRPPHLVLSDIRLPDGTGEMVMNTVFERQGIVPTIFMTAFGDLEQAVRLVKRGARDYIAKPFDLDDLVARVREIVPPDIGADQKSISDPYASFGLSPATADLRHTLEKVADKDVPVLLLGETGSGKSMAARFAHEQGNRRDEPFVAVNCASIPESLFESTLFGQEKGAFTGATERKAGLAEQAGAGTLFLDEIGEIDPGMQAKLLHLIDTRVFRRLGGMRDVRCDARFIFATNRDLERDVIDGRFREDLWFRINVVSCRVPPLRERPEEVVPLIEHHVRRSAKRMGLQVPNVAKEVFEIARQSLWRGNVRELINRVERGVALCENDIIGTQDFWPEYASDRARVEESESMTLAQAREQGEREHIENVLRETGGRVQEAAEVLAISRTTLWEKMKRYRIGSGKK